VAVAEHPDPFLVTVGGHPVLEGYVCGQPGETVVVDYYASPAADPSSFGEGQVYIGSQRYTLSDPDGTGQGRALIDSRSARWCRMAGSSARRRPDC
jgi:hypothetical protein